MGFLDRLAVRALPGTGAGLGMAINPPAAGRGKIGATSSTTYVSPHQPLYVDWDAQQAAQIAYMGHTYVMRCVRLRAETISALPFCAGPDPDNPSVTTPGAPLAKLLGPASPQEPGGPNPTTTARALWTWSIVQRIVTGRMAWEQQLDPQSKDIIALWPLVAAALDPIPSMPGKPTWFEGFQYRTPTGIIPFTVGRVFYAWRPSIEDWRQPESVLKAAKLPIEIAVASDRYMWSLLKNGMVASKIVIAPPFEDPADRRAWEDQFFSEFSGFDNAGKTIFAEAENDYDQAGKLADQASVQVVDLSMKSVDAQLLQMVETAKSDINIALGVSKSLIGDASQRIYANADSEYRNFWTLTAVNDIMELQDDVNLQLAPKLGEDVGWFDLSRVVALQPPTIFQAPSLKDAIDAGVISPQQASDLLRIPSFTATGEDISTAPLGEEVDEASSSGGAGGRSLRLHGAGSPAMGAPEGWLWRHRPTTTFTINSGRAGWGLVRKPRERITAAGIRAHRARTAVPTPILADQICEQVARMRRRRELGIRSGPSKLVAAGVAVKAGDTGRVLMLQRALDEKDPSSGRWEFPGGHIEPGEDSFDAARREWQEEVGVPMPDGNVAGSWTSPNGVYRGHVLVIPEEAGLKVNPDRAKIRNPDNPRGKYQETAAWFDPDHLPENPAVRDELKADAGSWLPVVHAAQPVDQAGKRGEPVFDMDRLERLGDALTVAGV